MPSNRIVRNALRVGAVTLLVAGGTLAAGQAPATGGWSAEEREILRSLSLSSLEPLAPDPSNRHADDPRAAALGHRLFFDTRLSSNGRVSCASCHLPEKDFQDGTALAQGVGTTTRRTMPVAGTAHSPWLFWDGRADSQWAQALGPLESAVEHGGDRTQYAHLVARHYREAYETIFGSLPNLAGLPANAGPVADPERRAAWTSIPAARRDEVTRVYANIGKAIAAYERRIEHGRSRFDRYVDALAKGVEPAGAAALSADEAAGLRLFIGKAGCVNCHNGALFTDDAFHNTGVPVPAVSLPADSGRATGVRQAVEGEFACTSQYSDAGPEDCQELRFAVTEGHELVRAYRTPSLRGVGRRAPYMHAGQLATLAEVIEHYDRAPKAPSGHSELRRLRLTRAEKARLEAFLRTLDGPAAAPPGFLEAPR
jgi:cytochrome c peroxidase